MCYFIFPILLAYSHMTQDTGSLSVFSLYSMEEKANCQTYVQYQLYLPPLIRFDHFFFLLTAKMPMSYMHTYACIGIIYIICFYLSRDPLSSELFQCLQIESSIII